MTGTVIDTVLRDQAPAAPLTARPAPRRTAPRGVPGWLWLLGVTVLPVGPSRRDGSRTWVVSAGVGPGAVAALLVDAPTTPPTTSTTEENRP